MATQKPYLNNLFAKARTETPIVSEQEIDSLLDQVDLHGQQGNLTMGSEKNQLSPITRQFIMGSLITILVGGLIGAGTLLWSPEQKPEETSSINQNRQQTLESLATIEPTSPPFATLNTAGTEPVSLQNRDSQGQGKVLYNNTDNDKTDVDLDQELSDEFQELIETYWLNKINEYKRTIDRLLPSNDREQLDRLRVQWAVLDEDKNSVFQFGMGTKIRKGNNSNGVELGAWVSNSEGQGLKSFDRDSHEDIDIEELIDGEGNVVVQIDDNNEIVTVDHLGQTILNSKDIDGSLFADRDVSITTKELADGKKQVIVKLNEDEEQEYQVFENDGNENKEILFANKTVILDNLDNLIVLNSDGVQIADKDDVDVTDKNEIYIEIDEDEELQLADKNIGKTNASSRIVVKKIQRSEITSSDSDIDRQEEVEEVIVLKNDFAFDKTSEFDLEKFDMNPLGDMIKMMIQSDPSQSSQTIAGTWEIANRNRVELDGLKETIKQDLNEFTTLVEKRLTEFVHHHYDEMPAEMREALSQKASKAGHMFESDEFMNSVDPLYNVIIEPMILLYNGSDINSLITSAIAEPVAGVSLNANSTLKQSYPNPATHEATIGFTLQEPSAETTLRLFDAKGSEVQQIDLGSLGEGEHSTMLNVSDLTPGTYLYHLTVATSNGEQVFSKKMQVNR